jgi:hypothetical protein
VLTACRYAYFIEDANAISDQAFNALVDAQVSTPASP